MELTIKIEGIEGENPTISADELARLLGTTVGSLKTWRATGRGPKRVPAKYRGERSIAYRTKDVEAWFQERKPWSRLCARPKAA